jgi:DNA-binding HxlR family transcriptional regulator
MSQRHLLGEGAAHRDAGQLGAPPPERVEHPDRIGGQVRAGVPRRPGRVADRLPRIAVVVPDDEAPALALTARQPLAEFLLPPVHRGAHAPDEQDRGIRPVSRGVHAQIDAAVEAFGDSWSLLVLRDVMFGNRRYFRELLAGSEEGIASNILADRLKRLVGAGLLTREDAGPGRRAAYSLTEASIQLVPVFAQLGEWGLHHRPTTKRLRVRAEPLAAGGPQLWDEFMAELRTIHLGEPAPDRDGPSVRERLAEAYAAAL